LARVTPNLATRRLGNAGVSQKYDIINLQLVLLGDGAANIPSQIGEIQPSTLTVDFLNDNKLNSPLDVNVKRRSALRPKRWVHRLYGLLDILRIVVASSNDD
jgi:hypothetical protein